MKRNFRKSIPNHIYNRGVKGNMIFYSFADCIFYVTLYSCLSKKYGIHTHAFSLMPNHTHSLQESSITENIISFNRDLTSRFTTEYNAWHNRTGQLFETPFGSAPKTVGKQIRSCISYINNNATAGHLSDSVLNYRWNLLEIQIYQKGNHEGMGLAKRSRRFRRAVQLINYFHKKDIPLMYRHQRIILSDLDAAERSDIMNYILKRYVILDSEGLQKYFGSDEKALTAMEANSGSEYDIKEDWEDYSEYSVLSRIASSSGINLEKVNFETMRPDTLELLKNTMLAHSKATRRQVQKYLHLHQPWQTNN